MSSNTILKFQKLIWNFYRKNKRDFPWRRTKNPYFILVSEVMLQQTQVERVIPFYKAFLKRFPTIQKLAQAPAKKVLRAWSGLGYNRRAIYLKRTAEEVMKNYQGRLPRDFDALLALPGVGKSTAGAVLSFGYLQPVPILETNIRKVFLHYFFSARRKVNDKEILALVHKSLDRSNPREWFYALMDYGAWLAKQKKNLNKKSVHYHPQAPFEGSRRQLRGRILKILLSKPRITPLELVCLSHRPMKEIRQVVLELEKEFMVRQRKQASPSLK